ncbi:MAG: DegT/DnrJ/EryC1/StrS family aminotransferase [Aggregatilineales bacterium]
MSDQIEGKKRTIGIAQPYIGDEEKQAVMAVLDSGQLVQGAQVAEFEQAFAAYCNAEHAIATTNGTTALTVALMAAGIGQDDEVIIPSFTFVATATSVLSVGAKPVFVDIEPETFCLDPAQIESAITERTRAIMPVHLYGHPANIPAMKAIADKYDLVIIEDAAQAHGAAIGEQRAGTLGDMAAFSFYPSKNMTTGEGGMVVTNDETLANKARMARNHGMNTRYFHETLGLNYRMTNVLAAIGIEQLKRVQAWNQKRIENAHYLNAHLTSVRTPPTTENYRHVFHQYTVLAPEGADRDAMVKQLNDNGVGARIYYPLPVHCQPVFRTAQPGTTCACGHGLDCPVLPVTNAMTKRVFSLPVHPFLSQEDLDYIIEYVNAL